MTATDLVRLHTSLTAHASQLAASHGESVEAAYLRYLGYLRPDVRRAYLAWLQS